MAKKVITVITYLDDLTGEEVNEKEVSTIQFRIKDKETGTIDYEIDLSPHNRETFFKALDPYITNGRKLGSSGVNKPRNRSSSSTIRRWAQRNGYQDIAEHGRIPVNIRAAYMEAHK